MVGACSKLLLDVVHTRTVEDMNEKQHHKYVQRHAYTTRRKVYSVPLGSMAASYAMQDWQAVRLKPQKRCNVPGAESQTRVFAWWSENEIANQGKTAAMCEESIHQNLE
jgi:hypothetical protein